MHTGSSHQRRLQIPMAIIALLVMSGSLVCMTFQKTDQSSGRQLREWQDLASMNEPTRIDKVLVFDDFVHDNTLPDQEAKDMGKIQDMCTLSHGARSC